MLANESAGMLFVDWMNTGALNAIAKQLTFLCKLVTVFVIVRLLLTAWFRPGAMRVPELSRALVLYLGIHLVGAIVTMPYSAYVPFVFYSSLASNGGATQQQQQQNNTNSDIYNMVYMYWIGQWQNTYTAISPLAVLFLTLERCIIIKWATNQSKRARVERWLCWAGTVTLLAAFGASTGIYLAELPLNMTRVKELHCQSVSCLMLTSRNLPQLFFKGSVSCLNIICSIYFLRTLRTSGAMKKMKNHLVMVTLCFEFCLNLVPAFVSICLEMFGSGLLSNVASSGTTLDACCCAIYFSLMFLPPKWFKHRTNASANAVSSIEPPTRVVTMPLQQQQQQQLRRLHHYRLAPFSARPPTQRNIVAPMQAAHLRLNHPHHRYSGSGMMLQVADATVGASASAARAGSIG